VVATTAVSSPEGSTVSARAAGSCCRLRWAGVRRPGRSPCRASPPKRRRWLWEWRPGSARPGWLRHKPPLAPKRLCRNAPDAVGTGSDGSGADATDGVAGSRRRGTSTRSRRRGAPARS